MKNDPFEPSRPTWGEQEVERITTLKEAMNRGTFDKAFEEMFPRQYDNPIEQVMFILGLKYDPQFESPLHAIAHGSNPGITNALDQLTAYGAIEANFHAWAKTVKMVLDNSKGQNISSTLKDELCGIIVDELDEKHSGGRWFDVARIPSANWTNMASYSLVFVRGNEVFCLPAPYVTLFEPVLISKST
jgi:hypothetical protein